MDIEKMIKCEKEAESGDGMSKLIIFCYKCFIEHTIAERDLKRREIEASEGNYSSAYILFRYNTFFAEYNQHIYMSLLCVFRKKYDWFVLH